MLLHYILLQVASQRARNYQESICFLKTNTNKQYELLGSPDRFWDSIDDVLQKSYTKESILDEAIWSTGILYTPKKIHPDRASQLDTLYSINSFLGSICLKSIGGSNEIERAPKKRQSESLPAQERRLHVQQGRQRSRCR